MCVHTCVDLRACVGAGIPSCASGCAQSSALARIRLGEDAHARVQAHLRRPPALRRRGPRCGGHQRRQCEGAPP
eukprot:2369012-Pleurochrysis_carterae.AAC.1